MWSLLVLLIVLLGALAWLVGRPGARATRPVDAGDDVDVDVLTEAEAEVRDVDPLATAEEAEDELRDWGPGAPR